jgi:tRNA U34 2-thiouridine synthase MnmA/TrmU
LNHDKQIQSLLCYRYTIGQRSGNKVGSSQVESRMVVVAVKGLKRENVKTDGKVKPLKRRNVKTERLTRPNIPCTHFAHPPFGLFNVLTFQRFNPSTLLTF